MDKSALLKKANKFSAATAIAIAALFASIGLLAPRRLVLPLAIAALLAAGENQPLHADLAIRCTTNPSQTVCRIDEPIVTLPEFDYHQVTFGVGDRVTVDAGGCVQTGGRGDTWKRYVNPSGPGSNQYYWGTISIPNATQGTVRLRDVIGTPLTVAAGIPPPLLLKLGYSDDDYGDNGYYEHDDGWDGQCRNQPNAYVVLTIDHPPGTTASCAGSSGNSPLDLVWTQCDPNGFPFNPRWQFQAANGTVPPPPTTLCPSAIQHPFGRDSITISFPKSCISWPVTYDNGTWCGPHVNFFAATYQGPVDWEEKSSWVADNDYTYRMFPKNNEGLVGLHPSTDEMEIEFDSEETIDYFRSPLWTKFHDMVDNDNSAAQAFIKGKTAVVTSLVGFDCGHLSCASEQHPAYTMALNMDNSNLSDDQWAVFARNWGDEGFCGSNEHNLPVNDLKVLIPWLPGASAVAVLPDTQFYPFAKLVCDYLAVPPVCLQSNAPVPSPQITVAKCQGILIDFTLPDPSAQVGVNGEVHLQWTMGSCARPVLASQPTARFEGSREQPAEPSDQSQKPEHRMAAVISGLTAPQLQTLRSRLPAAPPAVKQSKLPMRQVITVDNLPPPPHLAKPVMAQPVPNPQLVQRNESLRLALCEAFKNNVPGYPLACQPNIREFPRPVQ